MQNSKLRRLKQEEEEQVQVIDQEQTAGSRPIAIIESSIRKQKLYYERIRGDRQETKELNIHMKTLNEKYLKRCILANELDEEDRAIYEEYRTLSANFDSTAYLFQGLSQETRATYRQYARSTEIVKDILKSDRMFFHNKIIFTKFLRKVESGVDVPNVSWKQEYFKNKNKSKNGQMTEKKSKRNDGLQQNHKRSSIKQPRIESSHKVIDTKAVSHQPQKTADFEVCERSKQMREVPAFGQTRFGGGFVFNMGNGDKNDG